MEFNKELFNKKILQVKDKLDAKLVSHPLFMEQLNYLWEQLNGNVQNTHSFNIYISEDGKKIEILAEGECNNNTRENRRLCCGTIKLDGDALNVMTTFGTLYRADDLRKEGYEISENYDSCLSTYYDNYIYDDKGICLSWGDYGDSYPFTSPMEYINLREQVLTSLHKPTFSYNLPPTNPLYYNNASSCCTYRTYDNLGLAYQCRINEIKPGTTTKNSANIFSVNTVKPEKLIIIPYPIATWSADMKEYVVDRIYEGKTFDEVLEITKENFQKGIEHAKTKDYNPEIYENLLQATRYSKRK